ncbi:MAG: glycosyltransferase family 2 protein [Nitrospira sp.]|nr:glycosyltransferase family 2 protein [Nitrospira sp.]
MSIVADVLIGFLVLFSVRRLLWVMASWLRRRTPSEAGRWPEVLIAVPFRNEQDSLPRLLSGLDALSYDAERLSICLVDDASTDASTGLAVAWARERANVRLITFDENVGKAEALNRALASAAGRPEVIVVYDADQCPRSDSLRRLIEPFADSRTEAVCGYRRPVFRKINAIVAYGCLEAWTHQLVNLAAKEALGLDPPTMGGNCAYRRPALERIGGFPAGSFSEDIEVSLALAGSGGRTRFVRDAVADHIVADSLQHYLNQRLRWSRGLMASRHHVRGLEAAFVAAGYLDRVVLLLVAACIGGGYISPWWLVVYAVPALTAVVTAVVKAHPEPRLACTVFAVIPVMFIVDVLVSAVAVVQGITRRRILWIDRRSAGSSPAGSAESHDLRC